MFHVLSPLLILSLLARHTFGLACMILYTLLSGPRAAYRMAAWLALLTVLVLSIIYAFPSQDVPVSRLVPSVASAYRVATCCITDLLWFSLEFVPSTYRSLRDGIYALSQFSAGDALDLVHLWVVSVVTRLHQAIMAWFLCPRERTFLFLWSYPQTYYCQWHNAYYGHWRELSDLDTFILWVIALGTSAGLLMLYLVYQANMRMVRPFEELTHWCATIAYGLPYDRVLDYKHCRQLLQKTPIPQRKKQDTHAHAESAASRATASSFLMSVISEMAHTPWIYQMSQNDQANGHKGLRSAFWPKDLSAVPQYDSLTAGSAVVMVDVDYYVDMHRWLTANFQPHFLYTFQPHSAGKVTSEYVYHFKDNIVSYFTTGNADPYEHPVWSYQKDNVSVTRRVLGFPIARCTYHVERRWAGGDHEVVMLLPLRRWKWWSAWVSTLFISETPLEYFKLQVGDFNRLTIHERGTAGLSVSTAAVGSPNSITIPSYVDEELYNVSVLGKLELSYPTVSSILTQHKIADGPGAKTLTAYMRGKVLGGDRKATVPNVQTYQFTGPAYDPEAKDSLRSFMAPLALPCCAPKVCINNEAEMIDARVVRVRSPDIPITLFMENLLQEFVRLFVPDSLAGTFHPVDMEVVRQKQKRPAQVRIIEATEFDESGSSTLGAFMKKEPKLALSAPRNITTYEGDTKVSYSMFIYAIADYLKTQPWYAFGSNPAQIAEELAFMASSSHYAAESDGEKFDGHVGNIARRLETLIISRMFAPEHQSRAHALHQKQFNRNARTTLGVLYQLFNSRGSGSPETSVFNSVLNKFIAFVANRLRDFEDSLDVDPLLAYSALGKYGGDDGVSFDIDAATLRKAAAMVGQSYASEDKYQGEPLKFLSRSYSPRIWYGATDSVCDVDRSLRGFNCTVSLPPSITPVMKLVEKCRAYQLSDAKTPIIGDFVSAVMSVAGPDYIMPSVAMASMVSYNATLPAEVQYPNNVSDDDVAWMNMPPEFDYHKFRAWIDGVLGSSNGREERLVQFLSPPYCDSRPLPATAPKAVVCGDHLLVPAPVESPKPLPAGKAAASKTKYVPCPACTKAGKPNKHTASQCWTGLEPAEIAKRRAALKAKAKPKN